jgi:hypothetical protein
MGFFSFTTSDTEESIPAFSEKTRFIVTPTETIKVVYYDGYGRFHTDSGKVVEVLELLARLNFPNVEMDEEEARMIGIQLRLGSYYMDPHLNKFACRIHMKDFVEKFDPSINLFDSYDSTITINGVESTVNEHIQVKRLTKIGIKSEIKLKIAEGERFAYAELEEAGDCQYQGYFYEEDNLPEELR